MRVHGCEVPGILVCRGARLRAAQRRDQRPTARQSNSGGAERTLQIDVRKRELRLVGTSRGDSEMNPAHAGAHLSAELEKLEANGLG